LAKSIESPPKNQLFSWFFGGISVGPRPVRTSPRFIRIRFGPRPVPH